jgi:uncharacterized protein YdiU (UPF0061 family)
VQWNLERLADALALVAPVESLRHARDGYEAAFHDAVAAHLTARLGLSPRTSDDDADLLRATVGFLQGSDVGVDRFFFDWYGGDASVARAAASPVAAAYAGDAFATWWRTRLAAYAPAAPQRLARPYYQRAEPCSLLYDEIEAIWTAIDARDDWSLFEAKLTAIDELRAANPELVERGREP